MPKKSSHEGRKTRRQEILDAAQRFVASKGYEQMTIEDILAELDISKGAFYHYFESKGVLLEALIGRMVEEAQRMLLPILEDDRLTAVQKLQQWFDQAGQWKTARKDYLLALIRVWYHDDNAVVRLRLRTETLNWLRPILARVIRQGIDEGDFAPAYPEQVGQVVFSLLYDLGDRLATGLLRQPGNAQAFEEAREETAAFTDAVERALGARPGHLSMIDPELLSEWYAVPAPAG